MNLSRPPVGVDLELWAIEKDCVYFREVLARTLHRRGIESAYQFRSQTPFRVPYCDAFHLGDCALLSSTDASQPESLMIAPKN